MHLLMATTGAGKSTLARSLFYSYLVSATPERPCLVWLSEETCEDFMNELHKAGFFSHGAELANRVVIYSEQESTYGKDGQLQHLAKLLKENSYSFLFFDNITTSFMYASRTPQEQDTVSLALKRILRASNTAALIFAHTNAQTTDNQNKMISAQDIRGSKTLPNLVEYMYVMQKIVAGKTQYNFIQVVKARGYDLPHSFYVLHYDPQMKLYTQDREVDFEFVLGVYQSRNRFKDGK